MRRWVATDDAWADPPLADDSSGFGDVELALDLAGGPYSLQGLSKDQALAVEHRFGDWLASAAHAGDAPVELQIARAPERRFVARDVRGHLSTLERRREGSRTHLRGLELLARIEHGAARCSATLWTPVDGLRQGAPDPRWLDALENLLRVVVAHRALQLGGVLLHSSAAVLEDGAHLFLGPSGAGKTTVARLCLDAGYEVLSDDINAVLPTDDPFCATTVPLPFAGDLAAVGKGARSYPVRAIHRLVQSETHGRRALTKAAGIGALLASAPFVNADPHVMDALWCNLTRLSPLADELAFRMDAEFLELLRPSRRPAEPAVALGAARP